MTNQRYEINILPESIIIGNDAIFKCSIPSFVSDFVFVENWVDSERNQLGSSMGFGIYFWGSFNLSIEKKNSFKDLTYPISSILFYFSD